MKRKEKLSSIIILLLSLVIFTSNVYAVENFNKNIATGESKIVSKPLVILMDYADYSHEELDKKEDWSIKGLKGSDYTPELFEEMLFGEDTYIGSDGKEYMTFNKFYKEVSGGSYSIRGKVAGWYKAKNEAAYYGADRNGNYSDQDEALELVKEAIQAVAKDSNFNLSDFDIENKSGEGDYFKPDGVIDTVIIIHPGIGEEWGGGSLGESAIWPFRRGFTWYYDDEMKGEYYKIEDHEGKEWLFDDFIIVAQDSALDLLIHEYGHVLGLPDLYGSSGSNPPVEYWSIMGGSYTGESIKGSMPNCFGAYGREYLQNSFEEKGIQTNWMNQRVINLEDIDQQGIDIELNQSSSRGSGVDTVRINLPEKTTTITTPFNGEFAYFSGNENNLRNSMKTTIDLSNYEKAELKFKTWYNIDPGFDFATVRVNEVGKEDEWETVEGNITTTEVDDWLIDNETEEEIKERNPGHGITGDSNDQWIDADFDLTKYCGSKIDLTFYFWTDTNTPGKGIYLDDIRIIADGEEIFFDGAEGETRIKSERGAIEEIEETKIAEEPKPLEESEVEEMESVEELKEEGKDINEVEVGVEEETKPVEESEIEENEKVVKEIETYTKDGFELNGFTKSNGVEKSEHYYLLEWRNSQKGKVDEGLAHINTFWKNIGYDPGLLIWYIDTKWIDDYGKPDQQVEDHPGQAFVGIVDADQNPIIWEMPNGEWGIDPRADFIMYDAAFGLREQKEFTHTWSNTAVTKDNYLLMNPEFNDNKDYTNPSNPQTGLQLSKYDLKILVTEENQDRSKAKIHIMRGNKDNVNVDFNNDGLTINSIKVEDGNIIIDAKNNNSYEDLGDKAYIGYIMKDKNDKLIEQKGKLELIGGRYIASTDFINGIGGICEVNFIILEDTLGNTKAFYNSNVHSGYGMDLSGGNIDISERKPIQIIKITSVDKMGKEKNEFDLGNTIFVNTKIKILEEESINKGIVMIEIKDKNQVPYASRFVPINKDITEYSLGFSTYGLEKGEHTVDIYVWDSLTNMKPLSSSKSMKFVVK